MWRIQRKPTAAIWSRPTSAIRPSLTRSSFFTKRQYVAIAGRERKDNDVIAYHLRQSFKRGEITPEPANKIGYDLAMSLTKGKHALLSAPTLTSTTFTRMERI